MGMSDRAKGQLKANMFFSDEPGYYKKGEFGIRLETILRVVDKPPSTVDNNYGNYC